MHVKAAVDAGTSLQEISEDMKILVKFEQKTASLTDVLRRHRNLLQRHIDRGTVTLLQKIAHIKSQLGITANDHQSTLQEACDLLGIDGSALNLNAKADLCMEHLI